MREHRKTSGHIAGWMPAIIFNSLLLLIPFFAVQVIASAFSGTPHQVNPTAEIIAETRKSIDEAFQSLSARGDTARAQWANLVDQELDARNVSAARGFLLAAPQLLSREDARAIRAAASDEPSGTEDQRLLRAALLFLPNDVRNGYLESARPKGMDLISTEAPLDSEAIAVETPEGSTVIAASFPGTLATELIDPIDEMTRKPTFSVLGTVEDLANRSRSWVRGNRQNTIELKLTGLVMTVDPTITGVSSTRMIEAASVLKTAWRANRIDPQYARTLAQRIDATLPDDVLLANLEDALSEAAPVQARASRVRDAFAASIDRGAAARLGPELDQIGRISEATSARGALSLMEQTKSAGDVRKARLIAEAGGDRSVALASAMGDKALGLTGINIQWDQNTILMIMALVAAIIALVLTTLSSLLRMIFGRRMATVL